MNKALESFAESRMGAVRLESLKTRLGRKGLFFISVEAYPDAETYNLVNALAAEEGSSPERLLVDFGEYWLEYATKSEFGHLLGLMGNDFVCFFENINEIHAPINYCFPKLNPPAFQVEKKGEREFLLHYTSNREGLAPMVVGFIKGTGKRFGHQPVITTVQQAQRGSGTTIFHVEF